MNTVPRFREAMQAIAKKKGDFALFGLFMPADGPGTWDIVVAAPWLEGGRLKALTDIIRLLDQQLGKREVRRFAKVVILSTSSPEVRSALDELNIETAEKRFRRTTLFGADVQEAIVLRAKSPGARSGASPARVMRPASRARRPSPKRRLARAARG